mmetsp:Transcript_14243/g.32062  ORF Transcript_14243/g.32062 Transcript_14243/m.32062 type:complete len:232 (+) Transcript_14243:65-760(+)
MVLIKDWKEVFYVANLIDYGRIVALYWAVNSTGWTFAMWYSFSYALDAVDGYAARALKQESRLGYYLDMVIDRCSSCVCLHFAAVAVVSYGTIVPRGIVASVVWLFLYFCLAVIEIIAHGAVMILSEVVGVHQKQMGHDFQIVRMYLGDKKYLFWGCMSFELLGLGLIVDSAVLVVLGLPGFLFRASAILCRLVAIFQMDPGQAEAVPKPRRGSSSTDTASSPRGARVIPD